MTTEPVIIKHLTPADIARIHEELGKICPTCGGCGWTSQRIVRTTTIYTCWDCGGTGKRQQEEEVDTS